MKKSFLYILFLLFAHTNLFSQNIRNQDNFSEIVGEEKGDLNNDKKPDWVVVTTTKTGEIKPFRLQIFLSQPNSKNLKLQVSSTQIFENQYPVETSGKQKNFRIPDFFIEEGKLVILTDVNELKSRYIFRFKDGNFELTHISRVISDGREITTETEIDLLKGNKVVFDQDFGPTKKYKLREKFKPKPLPKIQNLTFSDLAKY
ncbi:hypothetical protein ACFOWU_05335 [Epilithonimonas zeae]|uniref:VCBS repeat-containing protein n=1 Tax=Epilithonimonas zeae TaxID=1416779 RepID=A0A1N6F8J4_9FLAO|nr:hypothetical protein [Epilithonimonas zeae]SIN91605.1 hypothetical protein SAMN05444409_1122 [Epilithonimonas zeae]